MPNMSRMNKAQLVEEIHKFGGTAVVSTRKLELQQQLQTLMSENGQDPDAGPATMVSDYQKMTQEMTRAGQRKSGLVTCMKEQLRLNVNENHTMQQLTNQAMNKIYDLAAADATDPVGFGVNGSLSYAEVKQKAPEYCRWVLQTSREGQANPRLHRLAQWLAKTSDDPEPPIQAAAWKGRREGYQKTVMKSGTSASNARSEGSTAAMQHEMMAAIQALRHEVAELQSDRRGSRPPPRESQGRGHGDPRQLREGGHPAQEVSLEGALMQQESSTIKGEADSANPQGCELNCAAAQALEEKAWSLVPSLCQGLVSQERTLLMEVCCDSDSLLTTEVQRAAGYEAAATRCSLWNACDLGTKEGLQLVLERINLEQPVCVWLSPPEGPYSPLQNLKSRSPQQQEVLGQKRLEARRVYTSCCVVFQYCLQRGIHAVWEMSERSLAWRLPIVQRLKEKYRLQEMVTQGCAVNLRDSPKGKFLKKGWRMITTHPRLARLLHLPCRCPKNYQHAPCTGKIGTASSRYAVDFAKRVAKGVLQELEHSDVQQECLGSTQLPELFGAGDMCFCQDLKIPNLPEQKCPMCWEQRLLSEDKLKGDSEGHVGQVSGQDASQAKVPQVLSESSSPNRQEAGSVMHSNVEERAQQLLARKDFSFKACEELLSLAPMKSPNRNRSLVNRDAECLTLGVYSHGAFYGTTNASVKHPQLTAYLNAFGKKHLPRQAQWTSLTISRNNQMPVHRDVNNSGHHPNYLVGLGSYQGGELWTHNPQLSEQSQNALAQVHPDGRRLLGEARATQHRVVQFDPKEWHATCPWTGQRIVITYFVSRGWKQLENEALTQVLEQGFQVPRIEEAHVIQKSGVWKHKFKNEGEKSDEKIKRYLYLLHAATGHGSMRHLRQALKRRNAAPRVLELAKTFTCSICDERRRVPPQHVASLEPLPPKWATISADIGNWKHPVTGEHVAFMVIIDEGSRYRAARILCKGSKQTPSAAACLHYLMEGWTQYFGNPQCLRLDPAGSFRSQAVVDFCDRNHIFLDVIPGEAHWQIGACEQAVQGLKEVMSKTCQEDPETSPEELLSVAVRTFNQRDMVRGFSPLQHAFGRSVDVTGRLVNASNGTPDELQIESAEGEFARNLARQAQAEKAHCDWQARQRLLRAQNSRGRWKLEFHPGQLVYFWRSQESGRGKHAPGTKKGRFLGPARVLATETRRSDSGELRPGSSVWLVRGRQLIKCAPEQLRLASQREELIEALAEDTKVPWTYTKVAQEIGGNQF